MVPRTEKQFEEIRNEKVELIKATALKLFAKDGYENTSISKIASSASISKGLMYNYFKSKEELLKEILIGSLTNFTQLLIVKDPNNIKKSELKKFIIDNINLIKQKPEFYKLYFSLAFQPKVFKSLEDEFKGIFGKLISVLVEYYTQKGEKNPYFKARFLFAVFDGIGIHYISDIENFPIDGIKDIVLEIL